MRHCPVDDSVPRGSSTRWQWREAAGVGPGGGVERAVLVCCCCCGASPPSVRGGAALGAGIVRVGGPPHVLCDLVHRTLRRSPIVQAVARSPHTLRRRRCALAFTENRSPCVCVCSEPSIESMPRRPACHVVRQQCNMSAFPTRCWAWTSSARPRVAWGAYWSVPVVRGGCLEVVRRATVGDAAATSAVAGWDSVPAARPRCSCWRR